MERRTRSRKHATDDKDSMKIISHSTVAQQSPKEPERVATYIKKKEDLNSNQESKTPKSLKKTAVRRTSKRADGENKTISKALTDEKNKADDNIIIGKSVPKRDINNSRFGQEILQNKEKGILSKATTNESGIHLNVSEFLSTEDHESVKNFLLPKFDKNPTVLDQSLSTKSHVSDRNVLSEDLSTRSLANEEDSFLYDITSRSPAKPVPRIEDSVAALDIDMKVPHEIAFPGEMNEYYKLQEPPPHLVSTSGSNSLDKYNCSFPINSYLKSPIKNETHHPVKETALQGLGSSFQTKKKDKFQMSTVSSTESPDQSQKSLKRPVCRSKSSVTICSPIKSHSTHSSYLRPAKADSDTGAANSHHKVVTKIRSKPNASTSSIDVYTRLSTGTPKHHSCLSKTNNSTLHISKERQSCSTTSSVARDGKFPSLNINRASRERSSGTSHGQPAVRSNEAKPLALQKPRATLNGVKSPSKLIPSKNTPAPHHPIQISKQHHKIKPLEDIKQNSLPRVNPSQVIKTDSETKINTVLLVRSEAAKRGRQAIQEWAEKQMAKT